MPRCQDPRVSPALLNKGLRADNVRGAVCAHPHRPGPLLLESNLGVRMGVRRWEGRGMGPSPEQGRQSRARPSCLTGPELRRQKDGSHGGPHGPAMLHCDPGKSTQVTTSPPVRLHAGGMPVPTESHTAI